MAKKLDKSKHKDVKPIMRGFTAMVWQEDDLYVAQCVEVDVASQGSSPDEAIRMLREAVELYFEEPRSTEQPTIVRFEAEVPSAP